MASTAEPVTVVKRSSVSPPPSSSTAEMSLPLTFIDMFWLYFLPIERLVFYEIPNLSRAHFVEHIVPKLELSLSIALEKFLPLAGNLIIPSGSGSNSDSTPRLPEIRYLQGDSVALTISECNEVDYFSYLTATADEARKCLPYRSLVPALFNPTRYDADSDSGSDKIIPVLGIQVTLFPNSGISIGISNHHAVGDASTIFQFMKTWANLSFQVLQEDRDSVSAKTLGSENLPFYDRTVVKDPKGIASIFLQKWNAIIEFMKKGDGFPVFEFMNKINVNVRKTFVITRKDIDKLKSLAAKNGEKVLHLSSFTVTAAYVWTCLVKSRAPSGEEIGAKDSELFAFPAECRGRMNPPLPENYFGNFITPSMIETEHGKLAGGGGFQTAVKLIGKAIHERLENSETLFLGAERWMDELHEEKWARNVGVAGSPKFSYYNLDFGWGKAVKFEFVSIDLTGAISLHGCRDPDGVLEVGLSIPKPKMDAFTTIFRDGLNSL
ncbi:OLC1v1017112C1 [Oldenlandia corymbosa var. corymbosa]|uniref:OLC1v1017112C1 n=1 Tax=Oldenlandia corymbosa var. corymbosa TaxID=529605 RepID=A0AAV1E8P3_OLDCO|nr:OLC1v1017112C1 [Oldenlandia corymbosa var. corymbosa]